MASVPSLKSTQTTSRPLNSRTKPVARQRGRISALSCGGRFRGVLAFISYVPYCCGAGTIILSFLSATLEYLSGGVLMARPSWRRRELIARERSTHHSDRQFLQ